MGALFSYGYTARWSGGYTHLLHLRARWYAPESGTFLSIDPVESEPPYQYVRGNVVNWTDASGMQPPSPNPIPAPTAPPPPLGGTLPPPKPSLPPTPTGTPPPPPQLPQGVVLNNYCYVPQKFSAGGYAEGWSGSFTLVLNTLWIEGAEVVYDFATMERANFTYDGKSNSPNVSSVGINISHLELATTIYGVNLNGFESWEGIIDDYSGDFSSLSIGANTPYAELGGGEIFVWSPGLDVTGAGTFVMAGLGASPIPDPISIPLAWTDYKKQGEPVEYKTGGVITPRDYRQMRNDIISGKHQSPHPNQNKISYAMHLLMLMRANAILELDYVWEYYHRPAYLN